jgi:hypothetical protein
MGAMRGRERAKKFHGLALKLAGSRVPTRPSALALPDKMLALADEAIE